MEKKLLDSIYLSIISKPVHNSIIFDRHVTPDDLVKTSMCRDLSVQDHLVSIYGKDPLTAAENILQRCSGSGIEVISLWDDAYPSLLREIHMPPMVLYARGRTAPGRHISIVGTRRSDPRSEELTRNIASCLAMSGITTVSGLALGIDRNAHLGALNAGGSTVAVLPNGVDIASPVSNRDIYKSIIESGNSAVISEYPPGVTATDKWVFARRNRIISGISEAVIVAQAPVKSGAMITARYALEQNRELYACPGNVFDESYGGCNMLIRDGAAILSDIEQFMEEIDPGRIYDKKKTPGGLFVPDEINVTIYTGEEKSVLDAAGASWTDIDGIIRKTGQPADVVNRIVTELEISGHMARRGNKVCVTGKP